MQRPKARSRYASFLRICRSFTLFTGLTVLLFLAACGGDNGGNTPSAQHLISQAQSAIQKVSSYHFNLTSDNLGTGSSDGFTVKTADGDILIPDKLQANANALYAGFTVPVKIIAVGEHQYYTDPITGKWTPTTGLLDPRSLSDSKTGVAALLGQIQNPSTPTASNVDGTDCWSIDGTLATENLSGITGGGTPAGTTVATTVCIGKSDSRPYLLHIKGIAAKGDTANTSRTFKLSKFNETLSITAPM